MKKNEIICILTFLILLSNVLETSASIKPIIVSDMPNPLNSGLQTIKLRWTIIDDNPRDYVLTINNSIWKNESLNSNVIDVAFSNAIGWYNVSLYVIDFSNNHAYSNLYINISPVYPTTTSSSTSGASYTGTNTKAASSPGFEFTVTFFSVTIIAIYLVFKRKKLRH